MKRCRLPAYLSVLPLFPCLLPVSAQAIVNVESSLIGPAAPGLHSEAEFAADGASGNTVKSSARLALKSQYRHERHTEYFQWQYAYGSSRGVNDTRRSFAHLRHYTETGEDMGVEAFVQASQDPYARMELRTLYGGGMRWTLQEQAQVSSLHVGLGAFLEKERLKAVSGSNEPLDSTLWRGNSYLIWKRRVNEQVRFYNTLYYQPALATPADFRVLEQASCLIKVSETLDFKLSVDIAHDSRPPQTVKRTDVRYSTGISASF
ncbi:MAG: DUF481 domain-containing protein [Pseudomonadota bacterium]